MSDRREAVNRHWSKFAKKQWWRIKSKETGGHASGKKLDTDDTTKKTEWRTRGPARQPAKRIQPPGPKTQRPSRQEPSPSPQGQNAHASTDSTLLDNAHPEPKGNFFSNIAKIFTWK